MSLVDSIFQDWYPRASHGKESETLSTLRASSIVVSSIPNKWWENLNRTNPHTGEPIGSLAVVKERMLRMLSLRAKKMLHPYIRMPQPA